MIKLVIFDGYGVTILGDYNTSSQEFAKRFKRNWRELHRIFYIKYFNMAAERKITQTQAWIKAVKEANLPLDWKEARRIHMSFFRKNKTMIDFAEKVRKKTTTLLLSKNTRSQFADCEKKMGFKKHFDHVINTWELNLPKASKETMELIMKKFHVSPSEIIYIDDQANNLEEAENLGINTIFYQNYPQFLNEFKEVYGDA